MARGRFSTSLYASLSCSQVDSGGPSTFGLEVIRFPYAYDHLSKGGLHEEIIDLEWSPKGNVLASKNRSSFVLGRMIDRGCFNYRWPFTEHYLDLHPNYCHVERKKRNWPIGGDKDRAGAYHASRRGNSRSYPRDSSSEQERTGERKGVPSQEQHVGTCQMFSCAMGNMFYQVLRVEELCEDGESNMSFSSDSQIVLIIGGPVCKEVPIPV